MKIIDNYENQILLLEQEKLKLKRSISYMQKYVSELNEQIQKNKKLLASTQKVLKRTPETHIPPGHTLLEAIKFFLLPQKEPIRAGRIVKALRCSGYHLPNYRSVSAILCDNIFPGGPFAKNTHGWFLK